MVDTNTKCPGCGANISIPLEGLKMTCTYCGHESTVPDAAARRKRMDAEERKREAEQNRIAKQQRKAVDRERGRKQELARQRAKRLRAVLTWPLRSLRGLTSLLIPLGIVGFILYQTGVLNAWIEDPATAAFQAASGEIVSRGYTPIMVPKVGRLATTSSSEEHLQVQPGYCYLYAASSNALFSNAKMANAARKTVARQNEISQTIMLEHCPKKAQYFTAHVQLNESTGSFTGQWFFKVAPPKPMKKTHRSRSQKNKKKRARRSGD